MTRFSNAREAKEFLVTRIVAEAQREGVSLSEIERKMLYFTETAWSLPDIMEVSDEFDRTYDQTSYENKITHLIRKETKRLRKEQPAEFAAWISAARKLKSEDHYLSVMIDGAGVPSGKVNDQWKGGLLLAVLLGIIMAFKPILRFLGLWMPRSNMSEFDSYTINESLSNVVGYMYLSFLVLCICGLVFAHFDHKRTLYKIFDRVVDSAFHGMSKLFGDREK
jgi:hypothetical protein